MKAQKNKQALLPRKHVLLRLDQGTAGLEIKRHDTTTITTSGTTCGFARKD